MTSQKVMLIASALAMTCAALLGAAGCEGTVDLRRPVDRIRSPYPTRRVWAVVPPRNESGTAHAQPLPLADHLARQIEMASNLDCLAVNRTLEAMRSLGLEEVRTPGDAARLQQALGADGLVLGSITAWDPYDPPKIGLALELYVAPEVDRLDVLELRKLTTAATDPAAVPADQPLRQPLTSVSALLDASDPTVREALKAYATKRGAEEIREEDWRHYRISIDRFAEFAAYAMTWRLLDAEKDRLNRAALTARPDSQANPAIAPSGPPSSTTPHANTQPNTRSHAKPATEPANQPANPSVNPTPPVSPPPP